MNHPQYRRSSWTPERRKAASEAGKARWAARRTREAEERLIEEMRYYREQQGLLGKLRDNIRAQYAKREEARAAFHQADKIMGELKATEDAIKALLPTLRRYKLSGEIA